jgi:hypothetical protein
MRALLERTGDTRIVREIVTNDALPMLWRYDWTEPDRYRFVLELARAR